MVHVHLNKRHMPNLAPVSKAALTLSTKPTRLYAKWLNSTSCSLRGQYVNLEGNQPYHTKSTRTQHAYVRRKPVDNTKSMRSVHDLCRGLQEGKNTNTTKHEDNEMVI